MSRSNNTTHFCEPDRHPGADCGEVYGECHRVNWAKWSPSGRYKNHSCIWQKVIEGRRTWYRREVNRMVRSKYNQSLRSGKTEMENWHKMGTGMINWYW